MLFNSVSLSLDIIKKVLNGKWGLDVGFVGDFNFFIEVMVVKIDDFNEGDFLMIDRKIHFHAELELYLMITAFFAQIILSDLSEN